MGFTLCAAKTNGMQTCGSVGLGEECSVLTERRARRDGVFCP